MEKHKQPTMAPGTDNLEKRATAEDIARDDTTKVTSLSYDEVEPSKVDRDRQ